MGRYWNPAIAPMGAREKSDVDSVTRTCLFIGGMDIFTEDAACGAPVVGSGPYCAGHRALCYYDKAAQQKNNTFKKKRRKFNSVLTAPLADEMTVASDE